MENKEKENTQEEKFNLPTWFNTDSIKKIAQILECVEIDEANDELKIVIKVKKNN